MKEFDKKLWLERAGARLRRRSRRGASAEEKKDAEEKWADDVANIKRLERLIDWCVSKGLTVSFGKKKGATYLTSDKSISIAGRMSPAKQLCYLLHECGHHLIGYTEDDERFGMGYPRHEDSSVNTTFHHKMACLEEEIEAWNRGWNLSKRIGLNIPRDSFDVIRLDCLRSYVSWANGRWSLKNSGS